MKKLNFKFLSVVAVAASVLLGGVANAQVDSTNSTALVGAVTLDSSLIPNQTSAGSLCGFGRAITTVKYTSTTTHYTEASCMGASPVGHGVFACPQGYAKTLLSTDEIKTTASGSAGATTTMTTYRFTCIRG